MVSSEANYDYLNFFIDGTHQGRWSGESNWSLATFPVSAGDHSFSWQYTKDASVTSALDTAWLDDIIFPIGPDSSPPTTTSITPQPNSTIGSNALNVDVEFSEQVQGLDATDLELSGPAATSAIVGAPIDLGGNSWRFPVTGLASGALALILAPDAGDIRDMSNNDLAPESWNYTVELATANEFEGFESGGFDRYPWSLSGDALWSIAQSDTHSGAYSARAGRIDFLQSSVLELTLNMKAGEFAFWRKISSRENVDRLEFFIDGTPVAEWSGEHDWGRESYLLAAGVHTFTWVYVKGGISSGGADTAWIDDISFPELQTTVQLVADYDDGPDEGFFDPVLGPARREAFEYALGIWEGLLGLAYEGETIVVEASMDALGGSPSRAVLGSAGSPSAHRNYPGMVPDTWYGAPLANHLAGFDVYPLPEVTARFNSDVDNDTVLGSTDWYYGMDARPNGHIDFVTVVLHEVGHGLNFFDMIDADGSLPYDYLGIYDSLLEIGDGTSMKDLDTDQQREAAILSDDLWWGGDRGVEGNGGIRPRIYAPDPYESGSSVSHLDETVHGLELMSPIYSGADHLISDMEVGMLLDMGWSLPRVESVATPLSSQTITISHDPETVALDRLTSWWYVHPDAAEVLIPDANRATRGAPLSNQATKNSPVAIDRFMRDFDPALPRRSGTSASEWANRQHGPSPQEATRFRESPMPVTVVHAETEFGMSNRPDDDFGIGLSKRMEEAIEALAREHVDS